MDPLSHGLLGAAIGHVALSKRAPRSVAPHVWWVAGLAAMSPDLDFFIPIATEDPTGRWIWHRTFTHGLIFIPAMAVLCLLPLLLFERFRACWKWMLAATAIGVFLHSPLDIPTAYGTTWFWPLAPRLATDMVAVVDPLPTLALLVGVTWSVWRGRRTPAAVAVALAAIYIVGVGGLQNLRAQSAVRAVAEARGHAPDRVRAMPTLGQTLLWRGLYEHDGRLYAVGVRAPYWGRASVRPGESRPIVRSLADAGIPETPAGVAHFEIFRWFTHDMAVSYRDDRPFTIVDARNTRTPHRFDVIRGLNFAGDPADEDERYPFEDGASPAPITKYDPDGRMSWAAFRDAMFSPDGQYIPVRDLQRELAGAD